MNVQDNRKLRFPIMRHNCVYIFLALACLLGARLALKPGCGSFDGRHANEPPNGSAIDGQTDQASNGRALEFVPEDASSMNSQATTLLDLCDDGKIDAGLRTIDGAIYLFKNFGFTIITIDGAKTNVSYITEATFDLLPNKPEYAITITDPYNVRYGLSLFHKNQRFYEYANTKFERITSTKYWDFLLDSDSRPFSYFGDSVMAYYNRRASSVSLFFQKLFVLIDLHTVEFAEKLRQESLDRVPRFLDYASQIIPLPDDRWLVFLSYPTYGAYCLVENVSTGGDVVFLAASASGQADALCYTCDERGLDDFLDCPSDFNDLIREHWFIYLWESSTLSQDRLLFVIKGLLIGLIYGLSVLYLVLYYEYFDRRQASVTLTQTTDGKSMERSSVS